MRNAEKFLSSKMHFRGKLCASAIAVSFFIIILSQAISSGFRKEIMGSLRSIGADITLSSVSGENVRIDTTLVEKLLAIDGVESVEPVIYKAGVIRGKATRGIMFKGKGKEIKELSARIPSGLSKDFGLETDGVLTAYFMGSRLKARNFRISDVYENPLEAEDKTVVFTGISDLRRVCGYSENEADALEIRLNDKINGRGAFKGMALEIGAVAYENSGEVALSPETIYEKYPQLFDWLDLIDVNVLAILVLMTIVAGFNMISGLLIMLFRSISTIGTLKSLGMTDRGISGVFLRLSSRLVLKGMLIGNAAALLICGIQSMTHLLKLDAANYFLSYVPVSINFGSLILCDIFAYAGIMILLLVPTLFISRVDPAETVKAN